MPKKALVIVDMQNDFVSGALANESAVKIIPGICNLVRNWDGNIFLTRDTHKDEEEYLESQEGHKLPIHHCEKGTYGWQIVDEITETINECLEKPDNKITNVKCIDKHCFGSIELGEELKAGDYDVVFFCGTCTDICVVSNVLIAKTLLPEKSIYVFESLCAGTSEENHNSAINVMECCQAIIFRLQKENSNEKVEDEE